MSTTSVLDKHCIIFYKKNIVKILLIFRCTMDTNCKKKHEISFFICFFAVQMYSVGNILNIFTFYLKTLLNECTLCKLVFYWRIYSRDKLFRGHSRETRIFFFSSKLILILILYIFNFNFVKCNIFVTVICELKCQLSYFLF